MARIARSGMRWMVGSMLFISGSAALADDDSPPAATPYRPTVTTPAALSAPHWLEGEFGGQWIRASGDSSSRSSVPYALKYAFSEDWGLRIDGEALVHASDDGGARTGFGDTGLVAKRRLAIDDDSALGLEAGVLYPTARRVLQLGSGKPDYSINGIYSADVGAWHGDFNLIGTRLGAKEEALARWQGTAALAVSHPLSEQWSAAGEFAGTRQHGTSSLSQFLGAFAWTARRDIVLDFGAVRGLNHATPAWQVFAGATVVIGRID